MSTTWRAGSTSSRAAAAAPVEVHGTRGALQIVTGSGSVELRDAAGSVSVDTGSGAVTVEVPATLDATVHMETGSGGLEVDFPMSVVRRESDSLHGTIGNGRGQITLGTGSGKIRLAKA